MSRHTLIDLNEMRVIKAVEGEDALKRCEYWADILIPKGEFYVCGTSKRDLSTFQDEELRRLINSLTTVKRRMTSYSEVLFELRELMDNMPLDDLTLKQLERKLGHKLPKQSVLPSGAKAAAQVLPKRPAAGTDAVKPWEAADWFYSKEKDLSSVKDKTIDACLEAGLNKSAVIRQFNRWKLTIEHNS